MFEEVIEEIKKIDESYTQLVSWLAEKYPSVYTDWCCLKGEADKKKVLEDEIKHG